MLITYLIKIRQCRYFRHFISSQQVPILFQQKIKKMQTTINHPYQLTRDKSERTSILKKIINWCDKQQENSFAWTAISLTGHGCFFTITTVMVILLTGNHFIFWPFAIGAMAACLIVNLAALPTKITIPVLFLSLLIDLTIIAICLSNGFDMAAAYR